MAEYMNLLISILGGHIRNHHGAWQTNKFEGFSHDRLRVLAACSLYKRNPAQTTLLLQGGLAEGLKPSIASVLKTELLALGILSEHILMEERSYSTFSQLLELNAIILKLKPEQLIIVSNEWHLPRVEAMIKRKPELQELSKQKHQLYAAEEVLLRENDGIWKEAIENVRLSDDVRDHIAKERQGVDQIQLGTYRYR